MTHVILHVEALRELRAARDWYANNASAAQAERLLRDVDARLQQIAERPESFPRDALRPWARRARLIDWPYTPIFTVHEATAIVLAVAHGRRRPAYWAGRRRR